MKALLKREHGLEGQFKMQHNDANDGKMALQIMFGTNQRVLQPTFSVFGRLKE